VNINLCQVRDYIPIKELKIHPDNPRTIREDRMESLCRSIIDKGFYEPILVWKHNNYVLSGNHRLQAVKRLLKDGYKFGNGNTSGKLPVVYVDENDDRAIQILFETNNHYAEWIDDKVKEALSQIEDIHATGFSDDDLKRLLDIAVNDANDILNSVEDDDREEDDREEEDREEEDREEDDREEDEFPSIKVEEDPEIKNLLSKAYKILIEDWKKSIAVNVDHSDHLFQEVSRGKFLVDFLRFKYFGKTFPRINSLAYNKHQFFTAGDTKSMWDFLEADVSFESLMYVLGGSTSIRSLSRTPPCHGCRMPPDFPANLAMSMINEFTRDGGSVLDPCHGWGGRLVGFYASHASRYVGVDCSPKTSKSVIRMNGDLSQFDKTKSVEIQCKKFEEFKTKELFDFAITSPPYFDVEKYEGEDQSRNVYSNYEAWKSGFYTALIRNVSSCLRVGGVFALQVGSQRYPLVDDAISIASDYDFSMKEIRPTSIVSAKRNKKKETVSDINGEVFVILEKTK